MAIPVLPQGFKGRLFPTTYEIVSQSTHKSYGFPLPYGPMPEDWWLREIQAVMKLHGQKWPESEVRRESR